MIDKLVKSLQFADFHVNRFLVLVAGVLTFFCMLLITCSVGGRYLLGAPIHSTMEMSAIIMVLIVFLTLTYIEIKGGHLRIEILFLRLSTRGQNICDIFGKVVSLILFLLMTWQTLIFALDSWASHEMSWGVIAIPLWIPKFSIFLGYLLVSLHTLGNLLMKIINLVGRKR